MKRINVEKALRQELKEATPNVWAKINANIDERACLPTLETVMVTASVEANKGVKKKAVGISAVALFLFLAILTITFMLFPFSGGGGGIHLPSIVYGNVGYVIMDINPSVQLKLDSTGKVSAVNPLNEDARVMLAGKSDDIIGIDNEVALKKIFEYAYELGYISPVKKTNAVLISAKLDDDDSVKLLENKMKTELDKVVKDKGLFCVVLTDAKSKSTEAEAKNYGITEQKMRLINSAIDAGADILEEEISSISIAEIYERMNNAAEKLEDKLPDALEQELAQLEKDAEELRDGLKERIEDIVGKLKEALEREDEQFTKEIEDAIDCMDDVIGELEKSADVAVTLEKLDKILDSLKLNESLLVKIEIDIVKNSIKFEKNKFDLINIRIEAAKKAIFAERDKLLLDHKEVNDSHKKQDDYEKQYNDWIKNAEKSFSEDWEEMKKNWEQDID